MFYLLIERSVGLGNCKSETNLKIMTFNLAVGAKSISMEIEMNPAMRKYVVYNMQITKMSL